MPAPLPRIWPSPDNKPIPPKETAEVFRAFARDLAAGRRSWDGDTARFIAAQFDELAEGWDATRATGRDEPLRDALDRGGLFPRGVCLELGSGTGLFTPLLRSVFPQVISVDLSEQMLRQAGGRSPARVRADATALPLADGQACAVAAIDMLLFPAETARVLAPEGVLLWINQLGEDGPLFLPTEDVVAALPGHWQAIEANAGWGSWAVLRRTR
ncbi:class I SAM-dependent methyltransferase [Streptomyces sp. NBC_00160]|uniref:class I SAM-dependent methyltransferase n=1 Tax=Streptomyces sp. NBC_00160 TaxID=2903628 RepID=UPI0022573642|nr:class I SAM-dependent methyltransferase [Streptomyces sp. NBC_00160]MCX5302705.1 class I SAM-dependent methyltransferase [Streptomyces sp. NBC_00160]